MNIVINALPIIFLDKLGLVHLLPDMLDSVVIPKRVQDEIVQGRDEATRWINDDGQQYIKDVGPVPDIIKAWDLGGRGIPNVGVFQKQCKFYCRH